MSLRYSFRHLFYGGKIQKERLYKVLEDLDSSNSGDDTKIKALEDEIGKATGEGAKGIKKDIYDIFYIIGDLETADTLRYVCKQNMDAIGDESTEGTILYRLKQLEDAE